MYLHYLLESSVGCARVFSSHFGCCTNISLYVHKFYLSSPKRISDEKCKKSVHQVLFAMILISDFKAIIMFKKSTHSNHKASKYGNYCPTSGNLTSTLYVVMWAHWRGNFQDWEVKNTNLNRSEGWIQKFYPKQGS